MSNRGDLLNLPPNVLPEESRTSVLISEEVKGRDANPPQIPTVFN